MTTAFMAEPELPEGVRASALDGDVRRDLRGLQKETAETVALHLVAAGMLLDEEPEQALEHARFARKRASRIALVREAAGIAAYHAGEWNEALGELRAARRMGGGPGHLAVMADIERALGRPERALDLARSPESRDLGHAERVELAIVAAGARRDLGEIDAAVVGLQGSDLDPSKRDPWSARLFYAYADNLLAAGRESDAVEWFAHTVDADLEVETDARRRLAELTGEEFDEEDDDLGISDVLVEDVAVDDRAVDDRAAYRRSADAAAERSADAPATGSATTRPTEDGRGEDGSVQDVTTTETADADAADAAGAADAAADEVDANADAADVDDATAAAPAVEASAVEAADAEDDEVAEDDGTDDGTDDDAAATVDAEAEGPAAEDSDAEAAEDAVSDDPALDDAVADDPALADAVSDGPVAEDVAVVDDAVAETSRTPEASAVVGEDESDEDGDPLPPVDTWPAPDEEQVARG